MKILVSGATGKMGREIMCGLMEDKDFELVGAVDVRLIGNDIGPLMGKENIGITVMSDLKSVLKENKPDVLIDFTNPHAVKANAQMAIENGTSVIIGTTGLLQEDIKFLDNLAQINNVGVFIAPNFAIGAILMMKFAEETAKYFQHVEIIELHHDQKLDAPSGTALSTLEKINNVRPQISQGSNLEFEKITGSRGGNYNGMRIHSVRLPGLIAHQEVIFGGDGQSLTIRHDALSRESYLPGIKLALKKVKSWKGILIGLENLL